MNVPNALTAFRFVLIPVYVVLFFMGGRIAAFGVWMLAGLTDILDGYLARKRNEVTYVGMMLDPLADKLMMIAVLLTLLLSGDLPLAAALAMLLRDGGMIAGSIWFHLRGKKTVPANFMGKLTTVLYYVAIVCIYFQWEHAVSFLWGVIVFSFITLFQYAVKFVRINQKAET
ncbi:CDP-alcohol phosphatidyltransferase family protein [Paenibacillus marinisediminis]